MFRLTREIRFAVNPVEEHSHPAAPTNSFAGYPTLTGIGHYFTLEITLEGEPSPQTGCVRNIKDIDQKARESVIPLAASHVRRCPGHGGAALIRGMYERLKDAWPGSELHHLRLSLTPFFTLSLFSREFPMVRLSQKFEFSASHRLHNPALTDEQNQSLFGKCNNPHGHGHNYVLQVTVAGNPGDTGHVVDVTKFEDVVANAVIQPMDHRYLNLEISDFAELIPTVENIARVIYRRLKPTIEAMNVKLVGVTLWETTKTWCEYLE